MARDPLRDMHVANSDRRYVCSVVNLFLVNFSKRTRPDFRRILNECHKRKHDTNYIAFKCNDPEL